MFLGHGHVLANAQSGSIVLLRVALAEGDPDAARRHLPFLIAFVIGLVVSRRVAERRHRADRDARTPRLVLFALLFARLALLADRSRGDLGTPAVGFIAAVQITSLSHIGPWSFSTGMTTGNLRSFAIALIAWLNGRSASLG